MITEKKIQREITERHKYCDVCKKEIKFGLAFSKAECMICGHDLCEDCIGHEEETGGYYRHVWCEHCWIIGQPYRAKIDKLSSEIQVLHEEWKRKCCDDE